MSPRTRFAPTPSGYLHAGNLANALLNSWLAQALEGECLLRIDADDHTRTRPEYREYIHTALEALDLDFPEYVSPHVSRSEYLRTQLTLIPADLLFACSCSRTDLIERRCTCRIQNLSWNPGVNALRLYLDPSEVVDVQGKTVHLHEHFGDVVLWRRDNIPAYHWANVIDDRDLAITHIVRGHDLFHSSALHIHIGALIGADSVAQCTYVHHPLLTDAHGQKLSKSAQIHSHAPQLTTTFLDAVQRSARSLAVQIGITPAST